MKNIHSQMDQKDWKLKLRYGKINTPYKHFTVIGNCKIGQLDKNFSCPTGRAFVGLRIWATTVNQAIEIFENIGEQIGYLSIGKIEVYSTEALQPPKDEPYSYDIRFTPYNDNVE